MVDKSTKKTIKICTYVVGCTPISIDPLLFEVEEKPTNEVVSVHHFYKKRSGTYVKLLSPFKYILTTFPVFFDSFNFYQSHTARVLIFFRNKKLIPLSFHHNEHVLYTCMVKPR